jgi:hypothetical protein
MSTDVRSWGTCQVHGSALVAQLCSDKVVRVQDKTQPNGQPNILTTKGQFMLNMNIKSRNMVEPQMHI